MRFYLLHLILTLLYIQQNKGIIISYDVIFTDTKTKQLTSKLVYHNQKSTYYWQDKVLVEQKSQNPFQITIDPVDSIGTINRINYNKQLLSSREKIFDVIVEEQLPQINWKISDRQKTIGGYKCISATGEFRGRSYQVWFSPEIPLPIGPWKLQGLPGAILEAQDNQGDYILHLKSINFTTKVNNPVVDRVFKQKSKMSFDEFYSKREALPKRLLQLIKSNLKRGVTINSSNVEMNFLELKNN